MHDATVAQIARRAGVSTGIISHYFKDKNGLLEATMRDITGQLRQAVLGRLHALPGAGPQERLRAIVAGNFDDSQISSAAMKAWLAFLGQQHASADALSPAAGQQPATAVEYRL